MIKNKDIFLKELANLLDKYKIELLATDDMQVAIEPTIGNNLDYESLYFDDYMTAEKLRTTVERRIANDRPN